LISDWEILDRAVRGDDGAWNRLVERHAPRLTRMVLMILGSPAAAQDLVQESFVEVIRKLPRHREGSFGAYLSTVAYHLALKEKKRNGRYVLLDGYDRAGSPESPLDAVLTREKEREITRVIRSLDRHHRDILVLRFYGEYSYKEIARITGLPLGTVKSRLFHAVKICRERMERKGLFE